MQVRNGVLKDHEQTCPDCAGDGLDDPDDEFPQECLVCDGAGKVFWGSWYVNDVTECSVCHQEKQCGNIAPAEPEGQYVCFDCYVNMHRTVCGCELWEEYESDRRSQNEQRGSAEARRGVLR